MNDDSVLYECETMTYSEYVVTAVIFVLCGICSSVIKHYCFFKNYV